MATSSIAGWASLAFKSSFSAEFKSSFSSASAFGVGSVFFRSKTTTSTFPPAFSYLSGVRAQGAIAEQASSGVEGPVIVITGASRGIGKAIALALGKAGCKGKRSLSSGPLNQWKKNDKLLFNSRRLCSTCIPEDNNDNNNYNNKVLLSLDEVKKILNDVKADDIRIFPAKDRCNWTDFMVFVTGRSAWHVRNIGQALLYQAKQKQRGSQRMLLPSVEGEKEGKWIVIDSGTIVIHALDEKARAYYNLERLWEREISTEDQNQDLGKAFTKVRRINNSKKPAQTSA